MGERFSPSTPVGEIPRSPWAGTSPAGAAARDPAAGAGEALSEVREGSLELARSGSRVGKSCRLPLPFPASETPGARPPSAHRSRAGHAAVNHVLLLRQERDCGRAALAHLAGTAPSSASPLPRARERPAFLPGVRGPQSRESAASLPYPSSASVSPPAAPPSPPPPHLVRSLRSRSGARSLPQRMPGTRTPHPESLC